jgi:hypothetical protein
VGARGVGPIKHTFQISGGSALLQFSVCLFLSLSPPILTLCLLSIYFTASHSLVSNLGPLIVYEFRIHFSSHFASLVTSENLESCETELDARSGDYEFIGREDF